MLSFGNKKKINSALKNNDRLHHFHNMETMRKILILFTYKDFPEVAQIVEDMRGKDIVLWTVQTKTDIEPISTTYPIKIISQKDISLWNGLSSDIINEFKQLSYDTLLDLTSVNDDSLLCLLANNSAEFCIGTREQNFKIYDFIIHKEDNKNLSETYDQLKFYLNNIQ